MRLSMGLSRNLLHETFLKLSEEHNDHDTYMTLVRLPWQSPHGSCMDVSREFYASLIEVASHETFMQLPRDYRATQVP